ncbi:tRNA threonylcarbamoyladenosine dehydratase [Bacteroidales bacterium OttesenSCG-928-A17]|nr:tRNA threonylcarbamoyladenosine dehydratase [Bacteroidales bacterium OttesenSCG-928-A17]
MNNQLSIFQRTVILLGEENFKKISKKKIIIFGTGGVGSWCAESLIRSGICNLTIVDSDVVAESNINRQLPAMQHTVGRSKVDVLKEHFLTINPEADITSLHQVYNSETADSFHLDEYDYVIDAIDSLKDKSLLIRSACESDTVLFSSMGAALKMDSTKIKVSEFWKVTYDPLARALRQRFKKDGKPARKFLCVYSEECLKNQIPHEANGTLMHVTASFGLALAGLVIQDIVK